MFGRLVLLVVTTEAFLLLSSGAGRSVRLLAEPPMRVEVCLNKHCRKRGSQTTLKLFEELRGEATEVLKADMSHTDHGCFDECTMGPNVRINGEPQTDVGKVVNGVKTDADVTAILGIS
mmetsp:Transcript_35329/g.112946  ORF Transcript_35329/g.112946 Transcript_35329/m.112946 type:complete len:119 (+) Transcript_35329:35-391(+)